jgi:hypothetical protein
VLIYGIHREKNSRRKKIRAGKISRAKNSRGKNAARFEISFRSSASPLRSS